MIELRRVPDAWRRLDVTLRDLPLALLVTVSPLVPGLPEQGSRLGTVADRPLDALGVLAVVLQGLPLAGRRRWPAACLAAVSAGFVLDQLRGYHTIAGGGLAVALVSTAVHLEHHRRATVAVAAAGYVALVVALGLLRAPEAAAGYVTFFLALALAWGAGTWLRQGRAAEAEARRQVAERTRAAERTRLARELHDVVTHHVTAMVVQAEAARYRTGDPAGLDATLTAVAGTGRRAIADLRHLLDVLAPGHGPDPRTPTVGDVRDLVEQTRQAGQPVEYVEEGDPARTVGGAQVAVYRVVQESLTNALRHAQGRPTTVHVHHGAREVSVQVTTDGRGAQALPPVDGPRGARGGGRGLAGLRDRVDVLGGELRAGPDGPRFVVHARIPTGEES